MVDKEASLSIHELLKVRHQTIYVFIHLFYNP